MDFNYSWQSWTSYPRMLNAYEWQYANYMKEANLGTLSVSPDVARAELENGVRDIIILKPVKTIVDLIGEITMLVMQHRNLTYMQT